MIAYGTECMWWDEASKATVRHTLLGDQLHCPHCGGNCASHTDRESYLHMARRFELIGFAGHHNLMIWLQGRCYKTRKDAWNAYVATRLLRVS